MDRAGVQHWLDRYLTAWRTTRRDLIAQLFTDDAVYRYRPYAPQRYATVGLDAILSAWLDAADPPDSWRASYEPFAVEGDRATAIGVVEYAESSNGPARTYHSVFVLRFAPDGRCAEFSEYYMREEPT